MSFLRFADLYHHGESVQVLVTESYPTLRDPMDCSPPDFSIHEILQARILEQVSLPSPGDFTDPGTE